ncbi:Calcium sensing receptor, chloroplastic [Cucurbita argyrosperma subsp. argyrosperma]|nr:Calcium sensing receptor, chloroplastic [Cucurbita argyrosperma subsp. argyrosperma]
MLSVCSATPSCSSQSKITFHGGLRLLLPSQKGVQVGSHGGFPKAFATRSSFSDLATSAQQQLSIGNTSYWFPNESNHLSGGVKYVENSSLSAGGEALLDVSGQHGEIPSVHETVLTDNISSGKTLFVSDSLNFDNNSVLNTKTSALDFLDRVSKTFNASIQQGESLIEKSLDTINSSTSALIKQGNQSVDDAFNSIFSSVDQIGEQGRDRLSNLSTGFKEGSFKASVSAIDVLRQAVVAIEDSLANATSFVVYSYGSVKEVFPPEIRDALSSSEQRAAEIFSPVRTGFQKIYITVESLEKLLGLDPSDPLVPFVLLVGSSVTLWVFYWRRTYGGYSGDLSPQSTFELLKGSENAVLIDDLREKDGIPDLRRRARARYASVTLPEVDDSIRKLVTNGRDLDDALLASVIRNLKIVEDRSKVIIMDANGTGSKNIARSLRKLGVKACGFRSWVKEGLRIKELKSETALSILNEEAEAILEEINPSPVQVLGYGLVRVGDILTNNCHPGPRSVPLLYCYIDMVWQLHQTIYRRVSSYNDAEDLTKDIRLLLTPVSLGAQALSWAAGKVETNGVGLPTSPSSSDVQNRVLQAAAKHESQPSVDEGIQNRPAEATIPVSEGVDLSEA